MDDQHGRIAITDSSNHRRNRVSSAKERLMPGQLDLSKKTRRSMQGRHHDALHYSAHKEQ